MYYLLDRQLFYWFIRFRSYSSGLLQRDSRASTSWVLNQVPTDVEDASGILPRFHLSFTKKQTNSFSSFANKVQFDSPSSPSRHMQKANLCHTAWDVCVGHPGIQNTLSDPIAARGAPPLQKTTVRMRWPRQYSWGFAQVNRLLFWVFWVYLSAYF